MAGKGRKPKKGKTHKFPITLPMESYEYLGVLAEQSFIGSSETDIVEKIVVAELRRLFDAEFHKKRARDS